MDKYLVIADDITGSTDTGVQLKRRGIETVVTLDANAVGSQPTSYVLDTESRPLEAKEAYRVVRDSVSKIDIKKFDYIVKKVDSTLRGSIAHEISAVDRVGQFELIIFMPALPELGRTTEKGIHMLKGVPLTETELAKDPRTPVKEDNLKKLLMSVFNEEITHLEDEIFSFDKGRLFSFDAKTNYHMQRVISAAITTGKRVLWVGSSAIVDNLLEVNKPQYPAVALVASISETTKRQVCYARDMGVQVVIVPVSENSEKVKQAIVQQVLEIIKTKRDLIIMSDTSQLGKPILVQKKMGEIMSEVMGHVRLSGIFVSGGDTAMALLYELGASGLHIESEVLTGIPLSRIVGGKYDDFKVITKAGAFGQEDALLFCLRKLKET